jgi:hypothetical protein
MGKMQIRVPESEILKRISQTKKDEVIWGWKEFYIVGRHNLCCSTDITLMIELRMDRTSNSHGTDENYIRFMSQNIKENIDSKSLRRWKENIELNCEERVS